MMADVWNPTIAAVSGRVARLPEKSEREAPESIVSQFAGNRDTIPGSGLTGADSALPAASLGQLEDEDATSNQNGALRGARRSDTAASSSNLLGLELSSALGRFSGLNSCGLTRLPVFRRADRNVRAAWANRNSRGCSGFELVAAGCEGVPVGTKCLILGLVDGNPFHIGRARSLSGIFVATVAST
jgi:hypothetical protein